MLLKRLIARGDQVAIVDGRLKIKPKSNKDVCGVWLKDNHQALIDQIVTATGQTIYQYVDYSTGLVKGHSRGFVCLNFTAVLSDISVQLIFNANTQYTRNTPKHKKGDRLPKGKFKPATQSKFIKLWRSTQLKPPTKLSAYPEKMFQLASLVFVGELEPYGNDGHRFKDKNIQLANISYKAIAAAFSSSTAAISSLSALQQVANSSLTHRQCVANIDHQAIAANAGRERTIDDSNCVSFKVRKESKERRVTEEEVSTNPINQSNDEWLADYGEA